MMGDIIEARRDMEMGMINRVVADEELMPEALALAVRLASAPTAAIGRIKQLLDQGAAKDYDAQLDLEHAAQIQSGQSVDFKEGVAAFMEKRPPMFTGG